MGNGESIPSTQRRGAWFARDDPVADLAREDGFGHRAYTAVLADAILAAQPPFTIGVFGDWGVGKTTITKTHLEQVLRAKAKAKEQRIAYAYFDVWKYEGDSLRRQFLRDVASQFKAAGGLTSAYEPAKELADLVIDVREVSERGLGLSWRRLATALGRGLLTVVVFLGAFQIVDRSGVLSTTQELMLALLVGGLSAFAGEIGQVFVVGEREVIRKSIDSPDLFEEKFRGLMDAVTTDHVVIVIDNLDRCTPDRVVEVLATVKTFLEPSGAKVQPVFVIPCDDKAIRRHLEERGEIEASDADEYLRKFFNATIRINPILEEEIRNYAMQQLDGLAINANLQEETRRELIQIISIAFRENPRRVKQFLNTLTAKLMLIREREAAGDISPPISSELPFLAKLTVIEEEWPDFYETIRDDPRSFDRLSQRAVGLPVEIGERLKDFERDARLLAFLRGTRRTVTRNIRAFTRLKLTPVELKLANFSDFRNALVDGRLEQLTRLLADVPEANRAAYQEAMVTILKEEIDGGYVENALNVVDAAVHIHELWSTAVATEVVEQLYAVQELRALLPGLAPFETLRFVGMTDTDAARKLIAEYLTLLGRGDLAPLVPEDQLPRWQVEAVRGLVSVVERLEDAQVETLKSLANGPLAQNIEAVSELARSKRGPERFLEAPAIRAAIMGLTPESLNVDDDGRLVETAPVSVWIRSLDVADDATVSLFVEKVVELFSQTQGSPLLASVSGALLRLLVESHEVLRRTDGVDGVLAAQLVGHLQSQYGVLSKWQVVFVLCALYPAVFEDWKERVREVMGRFASEEQPREIGQLLEVAAREGLDTIPAPVLDVLLSRLKERFRGSGSPEEQRSLASIFLTHGAVLGWEQVEDLFNQAIDAANFASIINVIPDRKDVIRSGQPELLSRVVSRLISRMASVPLSEQRGLVEALLSLGEILDEEQRKALRDHLVSLIANDDVNARNTGIELLEHAQREGLQGEAERRYIVEQAVSWLYGRGERIDDSMRAVFDRVARDIGLAGKATLDNLTNVLIGLLRRGPALRLLGSEYLVQLPIPPERRDDVIDELVHWARQEADVNVRRMLVRRAHELGRRDRRTRGWETIKAYLHELEQQEGEDRALAVELLSQEGAS